MDILSCHISEQVFEKFKDSSFPVCYVTESEPAGQCRRGLVTLYTIYKETFKTFEYLNFSNCQLFITKYIVVRKMGIILF